MLPGWLAESGTKCWQTTLVEQRYLQNGRSKIKGLCCQPACAIASGSYRTKSNCGFISQGPDQKVRTESLPLHSCYLRVKSGAAKASMRVEPGMYQGKRPEASKQWLHLPRKSSGSSLQTKRTCTEVAIETQGASASLLLRAHTVSAVHRLEAG